MGANPSLDDLLARCGRDLTAAARAGQLKPAYGNDRAVRTLLRVLARDVRHNPLVVGPARCGKTALVHEVVARLAAGDGPAHLHGRRVVELTPGSLVAGLDFDDGWRANLGRLLDQARGPDAPIFFLRDAHEALWAEAMCRDDEPDLAAFLEPYLSLGHLYWIAEGLDWRARDLCQRCPPWSHAFVRLPLAGATLEEARRILDAVCEDAYLAQDAVVGGAARSAIVETCRRFVPGQAFPGKAIDLLEDVLAAQEDEADRVGGEWHVTAADVYRCFGERTGLNRVFLDPPAPFDEGAIRESFARRVLGQEAAVDAVVRGLARVWAEPHVPDCPMAVFLFVGPIGVGKTELARTLAGFLFGSEERLVCFPMADYAGPGSVAHLFGDLDECEPEAERRGQMAVCLGPDGLRVALLDEFEQAHEAVRSRVWQLLTEGVFVNGVGESVNLRPVVFVLTSSDAVFLPQEPVGFPASVKDSESLVARALRQAGGYLAPELIGRLDGVCAFKPLGREDARRIAFRQAREVIARQMPTPRGVEVDIEDGVIDFVLELGYSANYGVHVLRQQIEEALVRPVVEALPTQPTTAEPILRLYVRQGRVEAAFVPGDDESVPVADDANRWTLAGVQAALPTLTQRLAALEERDQVVTAQARVDDLLRTISRPGFWKDDQAARRQLTELEHLSRRVERAKALRRAGAEVEHLVAGARDGQDRDLVWSALRAYAALEHDLNAAELESCLTGPWDRRDAILLIRPGGDAPANGVWATDLARMFLAWAQRHRPDGFEATVWDETPAHDSPGPASITILVQGEGAYGFLKGEAGTHRLAQSRQQDGGRVKEVFQARVTVFPAWSDEELVALPAGDVVVRSRPLRASVELLARLRSQAVAVHRPSEAKAICTSDLPPAQSESRALWLLRATLTARQAGLLNPESQPVWGTVVRTYDQYHTNQVRDRHTGYVVRDVRHVLAGHIDEFLATALRQFSLNGARIHAGTCTPARKPPADGCVRCTCER